MDAVGSRATDFAALAVARRTQEADPKM